MRARCPCLLRRELPALSNPPVSLGRLPGATGLSLARRLAAIPCGVLRQGMDFFLSHKRFVSWSYTGAAQSFVDVGGLLAASSCLIDFRVSEKPANWALSDKPLSPGTSRSLRAFRQCQGPRAPLPKSALLHRGLPASLARTLRNCHSGLLSYATPPPF